MNTLKYKDFLGTVAFSEEDNVFFGKIEGINGLVNFEGKSVDELKNAFHEAVDDYILFCNENNIEQRKKYSGLLNIRISPEIHSEIAVLSKRTGLSINAIIKTALEKQLKNVY